MIRINEKTIDQKTFPDGSPMLLDLPVIENGICHIVWCFDDMSEFSNVMFIAKHYRNEHPSASIHLDMPYVPNARMDRVSSSSECFTLKWMCDMLNTVGLSSVTIYDPHSDVASALIDGCRVEWAYESIYDAIRVSGADCVCFPDAGAQKRYAHIIDDIPRDIATCVGTKVRNPDTGRVESLSIFGDVGTKVLIVDDICSYGGTFVKATEALVGDYGVERVSLCVSHCEKSVFDGKLFDTVGFDRLYATDSILTKDDVPEELQSRVCVFEKFRK